MLKIPVICLFFPLRIEKENFFTMKTTFEAKKNEDEFVLIGKIYAEMFHYKYQFRKLKAQVSPHFKDFA
jgi:hypothetical protein